MDKPISVGDLVQVVRPSRCGCTANIGLTRTVIGFAQACGVCTTCGDRHDFMAAILDGKAPWAKWHVEPSRLKRIPPLDELEGEERREEITA